MDLRQQRARRARLENQVLGRVGFRDRDGLREVGHHQDARGQDRLLEDAAPGQAGHLLRQRRRHLLRERRRIGHQ